MVPAIGNKILRERVFEISHFLLPFSEVTAMRLIIWLVLLVIVGVYAVYAFATVDRATDQAKVDAVIARSVTATQNRDVTTLISCISKNYKDDNGLNCDRLRTVLARAISNESKYTITASNQTIKIDGDKATVNMHVTLKHPGGGTFYDRDLTILLGKENSYHMLIAPTKVWKVIGSANLGLEMVNMGI